MELLENSVLAKRGNYPSDCVVVVPRKTKAHGRFGGEATVGNSFNLGGASNPYYLYLDSIIIRFATENLISDPGNALVSSLLSFSCAIFVVIMFLLCDICCYVSLVRYLLVDFQICGMSPPIRAPSVGACGQILVFGLSLGSCSRSAGTQSFHHSHSTLDHSFFLWQQY